MRKHMLMILVCSCVAFSSFPVRNIHGAGADEDVQHKVGLVILFEQPSAAEGDDKESFTARFQQELKEAGFSILVYGDIQKHFVGAEWRPDNFEDAEVSQHLLDVHGVPIWVLGVRSEASDRVDVYGLDASSRDVFFQGEIISADTESIKAQVAKLGEIIRKRIAEADTVKKDVKKHMALKDGQYIGESVDWPAMKVEVGIQDGKIVSIKVLEDDGTPEFSSRVVDEMPGKMVSGNLVDVDGISGATLSSNSLKMAVKNAVEKAQ